MTEKDHENFKNYTKCSICKRINKEGELEVKYHDHIKEKRSRIHTSRI